MVAMPEAAVRKADTAGISELGNSLAGHEDSGHDSGPALSGNPGSRGNPVSAECIGMRSEKTDLTMCLAAMISGYSYDFGSVR